MFQHIGHDQKEEENGMETTPYNKIFKFPSRGSGIFDWISSISHLEKPTVILYPSTVLVLEN